MLKSHPNAKAVELITHIEKQHGLAVIEATICRVRRDLGLAPDCQQARAGKAKRERVQSEAK